MIGRHMQSLGDQARSHGVQPMATSACSRTWEKTRTSIVREVRLPCIQYSRHKHHSYVEHMAAVQYFLSGQDARSPSLQLALGPRRRPPATAGRIGHFICREIWRSGEAASDARGRAVIPCLLHVHSTIPARHHRRSHAFWRWTTSNDLLLTRQCVAFPALCAVMSR